MKIVASFMGFLALLILLHAPAQAYPVGRFTYVEGRVDITPPGQIARPVHLGYEVHVGDIIRTKSRSKAEITFTDTTVMRLAQNSRIEISEYIVGKSGRRGVICLFRGKIRSLVSKFLRMASFSSENCYEVHTPTAVAGVRGTDFFVFYQRGVSGAIFKEGLGYGYSINRPDLIREIVAGQAMLVLGADQPPAIRSLSSMEIQKHLNDTEPLEKDERKVEEKDDMIVAALAAPGSDEGIPESVTSTGEGGPSKPSTLPAASLETEVSIESETTPELPVTDTEAGNSETTTHPDAPVHDDNPPVITLPDRPELDIDSHTVSFSLLCDEDVTYSYTIDGEDTDSLQFENLPEGEHVLTYTATDLAGNTSSGTLTFNLSLYELTDSRNESVKLTGSDCMSAHVDQGLGTWGSTLEGTYGGHPSNRWKLHLSDEQGNQHQWVEVVGTKWSDNKIAGLTPGAWVNWEKAITGVCGGELNGTFSSRWWWWAETWQAEISGGWVETQKFLEMASTEAGREKLSELNVPCIEIGKVNLNGGNEILNVHMKDVTFFAYSTRADPRIWATDEVWGRYHSMPTNGDSVSLSGHGLNVDFTVNTWQSGMWGANVNGGGNYHGSNIQMNGGAAGTYTGSTSGDFSGTGAGVVR
jgi:hypothetical protein